VFEFKTHKGESQFQKEKNAERVQRKYFRPGILNGMACHPKTGEKRCAKSQPGSSF
jgi:hypothetical protein